MYKVLSFVFLIALSLGFRTKGSKHLWNIDKDDPILWVEFEDREDDIEDDLDSEDSAEGFADFDELATKILDEYNDIEGSYLELKDVDQDPDYDEDEAEDRTITIKIGSPSGAASGGEAFIENDDDGKWVGCKIKILESALESASNYKGLILHEIGHCLGLKHAQESIHAIMSYFSDSEITELQIDDKMGIVFLYPEDKSKSREDFTFGLGCGFRGD